MIEPVHIATEEYWESTLVIPVLDTDMGGIKISAVSMAQAQEITAGSGMLLKIYVSPQPIPALYQAYQHCTPPTDPLCGLFLLQAHRL